MDVKERYRSVIITGFCIIFYVLMVYKWFNSMFLYQMQPFFFYTREDIFSWFVMLPGIHKWLLNNPAGCILFDVLFYTAPLLFYTVYKKRHAFTKWAAFVLLCINWVYIQCYVLFPTTSIEAHIAWLLFPIVFIPKNIKTFALLLDGLRYFFLFFFASAGIWKFVQGGIFYSQQMSNILLFQHREILAFTPQHWYAKTIAYLIGHPLLSYGLYLTATLFELSFIVGFFTKKFDKWLALVFILFLIVDHLVMRIPYYETLPLLLTLLLSRNSKRSIDTL